MKVLTASRWAGGVPMMDSSRSLTAYPRGPRHPGDAFGLGPYGKVTDPVSGDDYVINGQGNDLPDFDD